MLVLFISVHPKLAARGSQHIENIEQAKDGRSTRFLSKLNDIYVHYATCYDYVAYVDNKQRGHLINAIYKCLYE